MRDACNGLLFNTDSLFNVAAVGSAVEGRGSNTILFWNKVSKIASLYAVEGVVFRDISERSCCTSVCIQAHFQGTHDSLVGLYPDGALRFFSEHSLCLPNNALKVQHHFA
ncbi:hypothetical protein PS15m_007988 [Mucor circinelloides]